MSQIPDLSGRTLGEYELLKRVGVGGMGEVYEGRHPLIGKRVAVKVLLPTLSNEKELVERFLSEARAVNEIRHRGIVDIFSFGQLPEGARYFVMEFLEGEAFDKIIKKRAPLPIAEALAWADEMLDALDAAHAAGIIHRDIKPSNLFLVNTGRGRPYVKLLDFGIAKLGALPGEATPQTRASVILGTPDYISPEQARGKPISPQTDLYALGCVIFEMVTGERVFRGENTLQTMWSHVEDPPPVPSSLRPDLPKELDEVILWALNKEAFDRPPSAAVMRDRLNAIRATLAPGLTPIPITGSSPRPLSVTPAPRSGSQAVVKTPGPSARSGGQPPISQRSRVPQQGSSSETRVAPRTGLSEAIPEGGPASAEGGNEANRMTDPDVDIVPPPKSKLPFVLAGVVGVLVLGVVALFAMGPSSESSLPVDPQPENEVVAKVDPPPKADPVKVEPAKVEPTNVEPTKVEPTNVEAKVEPAKVEPAKVEPAKVEPAKVEAAKVEAAKVEPAKVEPARAEPVKPKGRVITHEMLVARLKKIEVQLAAKEAETGQKDNVLRQFVDQARKQIQKSNSDADRKEAWSFLGDIEGQLKH